MGPSCRDCEGDDEDELEVEFGFTTVPLLLLAVVTANRLRTNKMIVEIILVVIVVDVIGSISLQRRQLFEFG